MSASSASSSSPQSQFQQTVAVSEADEAWDSARHSLRDDEQINEKRSLTTTRNFAIDGSQSSFTTPSKTSGVEWRKVLVKNGQLHANHLFESNLVTFSWVWHDAKIERHTLITWLTFCCRKYESYLHPSAVSFVWPPALGSSFYTKNPCAGL